MCVVVGVSGRGRLIAPTLFCDRLCPIAEVGTSKVVQRRSGPLRSSRKATLRGESAKDDSDVPPAYIRLAGTASSFAVIEVGRKFGDTLFESPPSQRGIGGAR